VKNPEETKRIIKDIIHSWLKHLQKGHMRRWKMF
jgi:hypothetical protein